MSRSLGFVGGPSRTVRSRTVRVSRPDPLPPPSVERVTNPDRLLLQWNAWMVLFHAALAVLTASVGKLDLEVPVYKTRINVTIYGNGSDTEWELVPLYEPAGHLPFTWLVIVFFLLSALFHLLNVTLLRRLYLDALAQCRTPTRWIEYFFSAPVMYVVIAYTLGIRNRSVLLAGAALVATTMPYGYWVELQARPRTADEWTTPLSTRLLPWWLGHIPQTAAWGLILLQFYDGHDLTNRAPWFVFVILWVELVLFFSFGIASLISQVNPPRHFYRGELAFQVLSLLSKGLLGVLLIANVLMFSSFDEALQQ